MRLTAPSPEFWSAGLRPALECAALGRATNLFRRRRCGGVLQKTRNILSGANPKRGGAPHSKILTFAVMVSVAAAVSASARGDELAMRDGKRLSGTVANSTLRFRTAYAGLEIKAASLASVDFQSAPNGLAVVIAANSNRFAAFLEDDSLELKQAAGTTVRIRRDEISRITFGTVPTNALDAAVWLRLRTGDLLSGRLQPDPIAFVVTNASVPVASGDVRLFLAGTNATAQMSRLHLESGGTLNARLAADYLSLHLDLGPEIEIHARYLECLGQSSAVAAVDAGTWLDRPTAIAATNSSPPGLAGLVWIPPGEFVMGSKYDEKGRDLDEGPPTRITIAEGFWMGRCEVTQAEYEKVMAANPSNSTDDPTLPVEKVSWKEAMEFCARLTDSTRAEGRLPAGYAFRLPTEAEWEYACRAGTTTRFSCGDDPNDSEIEAFAWIARNSNFRTNPVGKKKPNAWALHDMHGNVWEWCLDRWERSLPGGSQTNNPAVPSGGLRVARGGSWLYDAKSCRSANRDDYSPSNRCSDIGFRVVLAREP